MEGETQFGQYTLLQLLARGGMAEVHLARKHGADGFEKLVVIKRLLPDLIGDAEHVAMFLDEARLAARLSHSNIVQVLDLGKIDDQYFMAMEWVAGLTLAQVAGRAFQRGGLPIEVTLAVVAQAAAGLHAAHEATFPDGRPMNVVHRDVSPHNLVVTFEGLVKVVDFGIAKSDERQAKTKTGFVKGRFAYMSPEQVSAQPVDRRSDVWALGVVLHELATGERLFRRGSTYETYQAIINETIPPPSECKKGLPPALDRIVMGALAKDRDKRTPSAAAFMEQIEGLLQKMGKSSSPPAIARFLEDKLAAEMNDHQDLLARLAGGEQVSLSTTGIHIYIEVEEDSAEELADEDLRVEAPSVALPAGPRRTSAQTLADPLAAAAQGAVAAGGGPAPGQSGLSTTSSMDDLPTRLRPPSTPQPGAIPTPPRPAATPNAAVNALMQNLPPMRVGPSPGMMMIPPPQPPRTRTQPVQQQRSVFLTWLLMFVAAAAGFAIGLALILHFLS